MIILTADRIKELREEKSLTQTELAKKLSVTRSSVNAWEMGISIPSVDKIIDLADFFHVTTDYILGADNRQLIDISPLTPEEREIMHKLLLYFDNKRTDISDTDKV